MVGVLWPLNFSRSSFGYHTSLNNDRVCYSILSLSLPPWIDQGILLVSLLICMFACRSVLKLWHLFVIFFISTRYSIYDKYGYSLGLELLDEFGLEHLVTFTQDFPSHPVFDLSLRKCSLRNLVLWNTVLCHFWSKISLLSLYKLYAVTCSSLHVPVYVTMICDYKNWFKLRCLELQFKRSQWSYYRMLIDPSVRLRIDCYLWCFSCFLLPKILFLL